MFCELFCSPMKSRNIYACSLFVTPLKDGMLLLFKYLVYIKKGSTQHIFFMVIYGVRLLSKKKEGNDLFNDALNIF